MISLRIIQGGRGGTLPNDPELVARMAADLGRLGLPASEREAVRALMAQPYPWQAVARLAGQALALAQLEAVRGQAARQ